MGVGSDAPAGILAGWVCYNFGCEHLGRSFVMTADHANPNRLYFGDNLEILREQVADESVDQNLRV